MAVSQEIGKKIDGKKQIDNLISESNDMLKSLREFFYMVPIQCDPYTGIDACSVINLPRMWEYDPDMKFDQSEDPALHYRWFKLTQDQFLVQDELFRRYIDWVSSAREMVEKFSPEKLDEFDEESKTVRKWIEMSERLPSDDSKEMFLRFKKHFLSQQKIISSLLEHVK
ncbi:hypothetical protein RSJ42_06095 [Methanosarcina hadiensis]|uniref:hypothetical protein n=1 Tax=Methanosarcina hadiensis TaxID=3078083 RepID=UPI0039778102